MKALYVIICMTLCISVFATEAEPHKKKKSDWYEHFDRRLTGLEQQLVHDIEKVHQNQEALNQEMIRLNEKLESRFDKYFLWGYGTLLVVISTLTNVIFNRKRKDAEKEEDTKQF